MDYKNPFFLTVLDKGYNSLEDAEALLKEKIAPEIIVKCVKLPLVKVLELKKKNNL